MTKIQTNNLFQNGYIIQFDDTSQILVRDKLVKSDFTEFEYHTISDVDELTVLASKFYSKYVKDASKYWWVIADVNNIFNPFDLSDLIGQEIFIPAIKQLNK